MARQLGIGIVTPFYYPFIGGTERVVERVSRELSRRGHSVEIHTLLYDSNLPQHEEFGNVKITRYPYKLIHYGRFTDISSPQFIQAVGGLSVDIVHVHSVTFPNLLRKAMEPLTLRKVPSILITHGIFEAMEGSHSGLSGLMYHSIINRLLRNLIANVSVIGVLTPIEPDILKEKKLLTRPTYLLGNGVELPLKARDDKTDKQKYKNSLVILHVATLKPNKGHFDMLRALRLYNGSFEYHIVGDAPKMWINYRDDLNRFIQTNFGSGEIVMHGRISDGERDTLYDKADVVVIPSSQETLPLALLEAMSYGKAVIASKVGGIPTLIQNGYNGLLVSPNKPKELVNAIYQMQDISVRELLGKHARVTIEKNNTWEAVCERYEIASFELLGNGFQETS